jgi:hypothetical protein
MTKRAGFLCSVFAILACTAGTSWGQTATGQITGTVTDASGALVSGAKIKITSTLTGLARETTTDGRGTYSVPLLPVSAYLVTAEKDGFKLAASSANELKVDQVLRVDLTMELGSLTETVEVVGRSVALDSETAGIGHVITEKQVTELPLNGRNFLQLLFLGNGAVETGGEQGVMRQGAGNAISINGSRPTSNNYMLDGTSNTDTALGTPAAILSIDAIQEFKEQTATYSAEYGFSANQISIVSKTGTNRLRGSVFSFMRNDALDAKRFFDVEKQKLDQKQYGFVVGGPVLLPGYNGRNKTFFLVNYEGLRREVGSQDFQRVPLPEELAGRFTTTIIDPVTGQPFPNNTIPQARFTRLANLALSKNYWPAPNASLPQGNYIRQRDLPTDTNQLTVRIDQQLGSRWGTVFGRYTQTDWTNTALGSINELGDIFFVQNTRNWQVSHSLPISSNLVNQFRIGYVGARADQHGATAPQADIDAVGLTGVFTDLSDDQRTYPAIGFGGTLGAGLAGAGSAGNDYQASYQPMWDLSNTTTTIRGRHTLNFGANYRKWSLQRDLANDFLGQFTFSGFFTGNAVADMLLGYYSGSSVFQPAGFSVAGRSGNPRQFNFQYFAPYVQDDWKVSSRLTLNLGLRWDYRTIPNESNDRMGWRDLSNPRGGLLVADQTLVDSGIVGDSSYYKFAGRRNPKDASKNVFAPRIGFAFRPFGGQSTVVRGGYGMFWDSFEGREIDGAADIYPYVSRGSYNQSVGQTPLRTTNELFPSFADLGAATPAANTFLAVSMSPNPKNPYVQQWSLGVQRELFTNTIAEVNYIGTKGTNLLMRRNIAQALPYDPANPLSVRDRKPFPNFEVYIDSDFSGDSNYHSMNAKLERHTSSLVATVVYTWAKSTDNKSAAAGIGASGFNGWQGLLDNSRPELDRGRSDFDVDHRLVGSFVYNLPFGQGEKFGGDATGVKNAIIGGWQVNGIATFQRGFPMTIQAADADGLNDSFGTNRANQVGDPYPSGFEQSINAWFNTAAFAQPAPGQFGNIGRNTLRGPGINNFDLALFKNFDLGMGSRLQFRFESFNAFNHTQWEAPQTNVANPNFGRVLGTRPARINQLGLKLLF